MNEGEPLLEVRNLCVAYGKVEALHEASIRVRPGEIVTVIGPNGAGKTTLLCAIMGLLPSRGEIIFGGEPHARPRGRASASPADSGWCPRSASCSAR